MHATRALLVLASALTVSSEMIGYWSWNWGPPSTGPEGANTAISFTGLIDPAKALGQGRPAVKGMKNLISIGGGNAAGMFTDKAFDAINNASFLAKAKKAGFTGIAYDIEVCVGTVAPSAFTASFKAVKAAGFEVFVTTSHTAPYDCSNKVDLMNAFIPDTNIDYLSPQLYSSGMEKKPSFDWSGVPFSAFKKLPASTKMVPSIVDAAQYPAVQAFFKNASLALDGYVQWLPVNKNKTEEASEVASDDEVIGFWDPTWGGGSKGPKGANLAVSFSGWANVTKALAQSKVNPNFTTTFLDIGGGNKNGRWSVEQIATITPAFLANVTKAGYKGIAFDIEECTGVIPPATFQAVFAATKAAGLQTIVTTSHSKPYGCSNGVDLMEAFIKDANVDFMSPQLYGGGAEKHPDFAPNGVEWSAYKAKPASQKFIPSLWFGNQYAETVAYFAKIGLTVDGFMQWAPVK